MKPFPINREFQMKRYLKRNLWLVILPLSLFLLAPLPLFAEAEVPEGAEEIVKYSEVIGEVARINSSRIALEYYRKAGHSKEILIPLDEDTRLAHIRGWDKVQPGIAVRVKYKETYLEDDEGLRTNFKRIATKVSLVSSKGMRW